MGSIIFNLCLALFSIVGCVLMRIFLTMDTLEMIIALIPPIASTVFSLFAFALEKRRKEKLIILSDMEKLCDFFIRKAEETIRVNLARQRSGWPLIPQNEKSSYKYYAEGLKKHINIYQHLFCPKKEEQQLMHDLQLSPRSFKKKVEGQIEKMKLTVEEKRIYFTSNEK